MQQGCHEARRDCAPSDDFQGSEKLRSKERLCAVAATDIRDTQYGREIALKKRELEAAADKFSGDEKDAMRQKWDAMDAEEMEQELVVDAEEAIAPLEGELQAEVAESTKRESGAVRIVYMLIQISKCPIMFDIHSLHHQYHKCNIFLLSVGIACTRAVEGLTPNQAHVSLPIVWGLLQYPWLGCASATGDSRVQRRLEPWLTQKC